MDWWVPGRAYEYRARMGVRTIVSIGTIWSGLSQPDAEPDSDHEVWVTVMLMLIATETLMNR